MRAGGDLRPPAAYDDRWLMLGLAAVVAVAAYYAAVWWFTRPRPDPVSRAPDRLRERCLVELGLIERDATAGRLPPREAHQRVSAAVREFVARSSGIPARSMTLAALRRDGPAPLAELVTLLYPAEFGPDEERARHALTGALERARELVATWR